MRPSKYLIRLVVFGFVALDPSGGGTGIALGAAIGVAIGAASVGIGELKKKSEMTKPVDVNN